MAVYANSLTNGRPVPGPRGHRLLGSLVEVRRSQLKFVTTATRAYGDIIGFRMGPMRLYLLNHPDYANHVLSENAGNYRKGIGLAEAAPLLGKGLLTSEGELWKRQRHLLQKAFSSERMEDFSVWIADAALSMMDQWERSYRENQSIDVAGEMVSLTVKVLGLTLFRLDFSDSATALAADLRVVTRWSMSRMTSLFRFPMAVPTPRNLRANLALRRLDSWALRLVRSHREKIHGDNLLSVMLSPHDGQPPVNEKQVRDEVLTFLLAGHETTAATLTWVWYLLAQHPEVEHRLHDELKKVLGGRPPSLADLPHLAYTKMVIDESLRLYPPVWLIPRESNGDDVIGGYRIQANSQVLLSVFSLHRHEEFWPAPETFDPERFSPEKTSQHRPFSYIPFGMGPRTCLGKRLGLMEALIVVATVCQKYRFHLDTDHKVEAESGLTLHPRHGLFMKLVRRD